MQPRGVDGVAAAAGKHNVGLRLDAKGVESEEMMAEDRSITLIDVVEKYGRLWLGSV